MHYTVTFSFIYGKCVSLHRLWHLMYTICKGPTLDAWSLVMSCPLIVNITLCVKISDYLKHIIGEIQMNSFALHEGFDEHGNDMMWLH
jgi:hypothetical protein